MKKINVGELINDRYSQDEVIEWLAFNLGTVVNTMTEGLKTESLAAYGACVAQLGEIALVAKSLHEKVNGKKSGTVL